MYTVIFFGSSSCDSCKRVKGDIDRYWDADVKDKITFYDNDKEFAPFKTHRIKVIPTMIVLDHKGDEVKRLTGQSITEDAFKKYTV